MAMANLPGPQRSAEENQVRVLCRVEELQGTLPLLQREAQTRDTKGFKWPSKWENIKSWMYITRGRERERERDIYRYIWHPTELWKKKKRST